MPSNLVPQKEIDIVKKAQHDLENFSILYERYFEKVYRYFHFRLRNDIESQDLTSATFEKVITKLHTYKDYGYPFAAWLFRIARNTLIDHFRTKQKQKTVSFEELGMNEQPFVCLDATLIDNQEAIEKIKHIIATLPQLQQDIWALKLGSDLSHKTIAETLKIRENYVNVLLFRSIQVIKQKLLRSQ